MTDEDVPLETHAQNQKTLRYVGCVVDDVADAVMYGNVVDYGAVLHVIEIVRQQLAWNGPLH